MPTAITPIRGATASGPALRRLHLAVPTAMFLVGSATLAQAMPLPSDGSSRSINVNIHAGAAPVIAAPLAAAVDWPQPGLNAQHTGNNKKETTIGAANIGSLTQKWAVPQSNTLQSAPIELKGVVYTQTGDGTVYAVKAKTGKTLWTTATGSISGSGVAGVTSGDNLIYAPCYADGNSHWGICGLNAATGAIVWKFTFSDCGNGVPPTYTTPDNVPVYDHGMVFFGISFGGFNSACSGGYLVALNATTGTNAWPLYAPALGGHVAGPFAVDKGTVFYQSASGYASICAANEADGSPKGCTAAYQYTTDFGITVGAGKIIAQYTDDAGGLQVAAFDEGTLALDWQQTISSRNGSYFLPTLDGGLGYFLTGNNNDVDVYALSLKTGKPRWSFPCNFAVACLNSGVSAANGVLFAQCYVQGQPGDQCALDAKTGALLRVYGAATSFKGSGSTPLVANGAEIAACNGGANLCEFAP